MQKLILICNFQNLLTNFLLGYIIEARKGAHTMNAFKSDRKMNYHYEPYCNDPMPYGCIDLLQIGSSHFQPGTAVNLHTHSGYFELTVITLGRGVISANNSSVPVEQGDIFVSFPYDTHSIEADKSEGMNYMFFAFFLKDQALLSDMEKISAIRSMTNERIIHSDTTASLLTSAIAELGKERLHQRTYLEALFSQIVIHVIRAFNKQESAVFAPGRQEELCYQVMDYINTHIYSIGALTEISDLFRYDYTYLSKIFTKTTSQSISEYYRQRRLEVARALIHEGALNLSEIAEKLQYSSIYSFSKAFKNQYGLSPRDYKKKNAEN